MKKRYIFLLLISLMQHNDILISSSFYNYLFTPSTPITPEEQYEKIINSWQPQYWHLQGFKAHDMQTLSNVIQEDIKHQNINFEDLPTILKKLQLYPIANQYQSEFKQILQIIENKIQPIILEEIHNKIFKISQEHPALIIPAAGKVQTIDEYIQDIRNKLDNKKLFKRQVEQIDFNTIYKNLENFKYIIDSRGDGNCGYRAIIISSYIDYPTQMNNYFTNLLENKFVTLFTQYDTNFEIENREIIGTMILDYMLSVLRSLKKHKKIDNFITILNKEITFDYYMIMFMRYIVADYIEKNNPDELVYSINSKDEIVQNTLKWKNELDDLETKLLTKATSIKIETIQENALQNAIITTDTKNPVGHAYISYTTSPGHYKILVKNHDPFKNNDNPLLQPIMPIKFYKPYL